MASTVINTREDLDSIIDTPEHDAFIAALAGTIWRLERDDANKAYVAVKDLSTITAFGFTEQDFNVPPPTLPVWQPLKTDAELLADFQAVIQQRLDAFAQTRNYDGILSAASYATSTNPTFSAEGQYCVQLRDDTWAAAYQILADVLAGNRPMPQAIADIEADLPAAVWPA